MPLKFFQKVFKPFCRIGEVLKKLQGLFSFEMLSKAGMLNTQNPRHEKEA